MKAITFRATPEDYQIIVDVMAATGLSQSDAIREMVRFGALRSLSERNAERAAAEARLKQKLGG